MSEIPATAVEAAAKAHFEEAMADEERWVSWADLPPDARERWCDLLRSALAAAAPLIRQATADEIEQLADDPIFRDNIINQWEDHDDSGTAFLRGMKQAAFVVRVGGGGGGGQ
jgi:hypothetical protein